MKTNTLLSSLAIVSLAAACGGSDEPTLDAEFTGATDAQLLRAQSAGGAGDAMLAMIFASNFVGTDEPGGCPSIVTTGDTTTITGGCTTEFGTTFEGTATIRAIEPDGDAGDYAFDGFSIADDGEAWAFDGTVALTENALTVDLVATLEGVTATSSLRLAVAQGGMVTPSDDSWVDVDGLGAARVSGGWTYDDPPAGELTLEGAGRITFDFDASSGGCVAYVIDGEVGGELCDGDEL